jgi:CheY-like chemotaxis protein
MMPRVDGWSVLERLAERPAADRPHVVMLTALAGPSDRARAEALGVDAFVTKPFDMDHLVSVLRGLGEDAVLASGHAGAAKIA